MIISEVVFAKGRRFAQAWRKRTTLAYTRFMAQSCDAFVDSSVPTDALIRPLIQASELLSRINDHFSYDDTDNSDIRGELMLDISATSFLGELKRVKEVIPTTLQKNSQFTLPP
jgi:hypothetical protein